MKLQVPLIKPREGFADAYKAAIGSAYISHRDAVGELTLTVTREGLVEAARIARDQFGYQQLMEIAGVDYPQRPERFEVDYHLLSITANHRIRLKVTTSEEIPVPSLTGLWPVAGWLEREVFDMYGVAFSGNSDLRRILTDYGFEGYPQRKDFPLTGYVELRYSEAEKRVVYEPVKLPQDFRTFDFLMPWEGPEYRLPGDEKATPEAPGAPSPAPAPSGQGKPNPDTPAKTRKTTAKPAHTGAGKKANKAAARKSKTAPKASGEGQPKGKKG